MCETGVEHLLHIFLDCNFTKECWRVMGLSLDVSTVEAAPVWILDRLATETNEVKVQIATVQWGVRVLEILRFGSKKC